MWDYFKIRYRGKSRKWWRRRNKCALVKMDAEKVTGND